jgi:hypothetical protein
MIANAGTTNNHGIRLVVSNRIASQTATAATKAKPTPKITALLFGIRGIGRSIFMVRW